MKIVFCRIPALILSINFNLVPWKKCKYLCILFFYSVIVCLFLNLHQSNDNDYYSIVYDLYMIYCSVSIIINEMTRRKKKNKIEKARLPDKINGPKNGHKYVKINFYAAHKQRRKQRTQITYTNLK